MCLTLDGEQGKEKKIWLCFLLYCQATVDSYLVPGVH